MNVIFMFREYDLFSLGPQPWHWSEAGSWEAVKGAGPGVRPPGFELQCFKVCDLQHIS